MALTYQPMDVLALIDDRVAERQAGNPGYLLAKDVDGGRFGNREEQFWRSLKHMLAGLDQDSLGLSASDMAALARADTAMRVTDSAVGVLPMSHGGEGKLSPAHVIQKVLRNARPAGLPDRFPELNFLRIRDGQLHQRCVDALGEAQDALAARRYRSCAVVAVFVMEALVSWWLRQPEAAYGWPKNKKAADELGLSAMVDACKASLFTPDPGLNKKDHPEIEHLHGKCLDAASLRNLIHADKARRSTRDIDAAAAHSALGATLSLAQRLSQLNP